MSNYRGYEILLTQILDNVTPPFLRDAKWFMYLPFKILFKDKADLFFHFKENAFSMTEKEFANVYKQVSMFGERDTDLNKECIDEILTNIKGKKVLEVGCGKGFLCNLMSEKADVTGVDIVVPSRIKRTYKNVTFKEGAVENLPFKQKSYDTVVCTHTVEHVQDITKAISELRRVTKKRLIIVVPKQRPYKYTFNLHLHFFPYLFSFIAIMGHQKKSVCRDVGGDIYYSEDRG